MEDIVGEFGENWVKWPSVRHSLCQDASFEVLHAKLGSLGGILSNDTHYGIPDGQDASIEVLHAKIGFGSFLSKIVGFGEL